MRKLQSLLQDPCYVFICQLKVKLFMAEIHWYNNNHNNNNNNNNSQFFAAFPKSKSNMEYFQKKDDDPRLFVYEIMDCKKPSYLNAQKAPCQNTYGKSTCQRVRNSA